MTGFVFLRSVHEYLSSLKENTETKITPQIASLDKYKNKLNFKNSYFDLDKEYEGLYKRVFFQIWL